MNVLSYEKKLMLRLWQTWLNNPCFLALVVVVRYRPVFTRRAKMVIQGELVWEDSRSLLEGLKTTAKESLTVSSSKFELAYMSG